MAGCVAGEAGLRLTRGSRHRESQYRFGHSATRELSIADFTTKKKAAPLFAQLPMSAQQWIGSAAADGDYQTVKLLRDSLVHARVRRHFTMPRQRLQIQAG